MIRHRSRSFRPGKIDLERRDMLTASGVWIGQDLHDYVSPAFALGGNGVQDIHIALSQLPATRTIVWADVTGLGGGDWQYQGASNTWAAAINRTAGSTSADLYIDPYQTETGRPFSITLKYDDNSQNQFWVTGGAADPNLRMPSASAKLSWVGQDGQDAVGAGASVGPDGFQDAHLTLTNLSASDAISSVTITTGSGLAWASGLNPSGLNNAQFNRHADDPTRADILIDPLGDIFGQTITAKILYATGKTDTATTVAGHTNASLTQPSTAGPVPTILGGMSATWIGQDGQDLAGPGSARVSLSGIPAGKTVVAAALSDQNRGLWTYKSAAGSGVYFDSWSQALGVQVSGSKADVSFAPQNDEVGSVLTIRLIFSDGTSAVAWVSAGTTDPARRANALASTSVLAHPGDDLNALANQYGVVRLSAGNYTLSKPLILNNPVTIAADPGVTLQFTQGTGDPAWSTAIKINAGNTTLSGFAVRFTGPVRWADGVNYGPAVIGTTDNLDPNPGSLKAGLVITGLDLESPPVAAGLPAVEAPRLIRLASGIDGTISNNRLKGGTTEFLGGPWTITNNTYLGTVANTFCWTAFAGHSTYDLVLQGNTAKPDSGTGRTWRFLVLTGTGSNDLIADNTVSGIGPRDGDTVDMNAAEIFLTESYSLQFEGIPTSISSDGRILQIPTPQGGPAQTGDVVAILSGPSGGQYRRISQALGPQTYLMDSPLPTGNYAISIVSGFVNETFRGNTVDARGSSGAGDMVFVGNQFGSTIANNHLLGGAQSLLVTAAPSEHPVEWGWSHAPFLGATISGNIFEDSLTAATIAVEHSSAIKSDAGRVYFSGSLTNNTVTWTSSFLAARGSSNPPQGIFVGQAGSLDPGELVLSTSGNGASYPAGTTAPTLKIIAGTVDGQALTNTSRSLDSTAPPLTSSFGGGPTGLSLVVDTGLSNQDRWTTDGRLKFDPVSGASSYEYLISGAASYLPLASAGVFAPAGLVQGQNTVWVRAIDSKGNRSASTMYQFFLDNSAPITTIPFLRPQDDTGVSATDRLTNVTTPSFNVTGDPTDTIVLVRDGVPIDRRIGTGVLIDSSPRPNGTYGYLLHRYDAAGNESWSPTVNVTIDTTPPAGISNVVISSTGNVTFTGTGSTDTYEYQNGAAGAFFDLKQRTYFTAATGGQIGIRSVDAAGNAGPETWVTWASGTASPVQGGSSPTPPTSGTPQGPAVLSPKARRAAKAAARAKAMALARAKRLAAAHARALAHHK